MAEMFSVYFVKLHILKQHVFCRLDSFQVSTELSLKLVTNPQSKLYLFFMSLCKAPDYFPVTRNPTNYLQNCNIFPDKAPISTNSVPFSSAL